jgi:hypothetical protein
MGLIDGLRAVLGLGAEAGATRDADADALFGMGTAYLTMDADLGYSPAETAALCFSGVDSTAFSAVLDDVRAILDAGAATTGTEFAVETDDHGWRWVIVHDDDPEDLLTSIHFAADEFIANGYGSRLLVAVFGFVSGAGRAYWVYSFRRGGYYPFIPTGTDSRDVRGEQKLAGVLGGELDIEDDRDYWYPLWPAHRGGHPWEGG